MKKWMCESTASWGEEQTAHIRPVKRNVPPGHTSDELHRCLPVSVSMVAVALALCFQFGCSTPTAFRLLENFESDALGVVPPRDPEPTPPADMLIWGTGRVSSRVVPRETGGRWNRIDITEPFVNDQEYRLALQGVTDTFIKPGAGIRGHLTARVVGRSPTETRGRVTIYLQTAQTDHSPPGNLGGLQILNGSFAYVMGNDIKSWIRSGESNPRFSTHLGDFNVGDIIDIFWSVDQSNHMLNLTAGVGNSVQIPFDASLIPIKRIWLSIAIYDFTVGTALFLDNLSVEEM
jgi:hypothetical protein